MTDYTYIKVIPIRTTRKNIGLGHSLEKKLNDLISFNNSNNNIKEMLTYFKDKSYKLKSKYKI